MKDHKEVQASMTQQRRMLKQQDPTPTWTGLFNRNRAATNGMSLDYIPPELVDGSVIVNLDKGETEKEIDK